MHDVFETFHGMASKATHVVNYALRWFFGLKSTVMSSEVKRSNVQSAPAMSAIDVECLEERDSAENPVSEIVLDLTSGPHSENNSSNVLAIRKTDDTIRLSQSSKCNKVLAQQTEISGSKNLSRKSSAAEIQMTVSSYFPYFVSGKSPFILANAFLPSFTRNLDNQLILYTFFVFTL